MWCVSIELPFRILMEGWSFFVVGGGRRVEVYDIMRYEGALYMCMHPPVEILPHFLINHSECGCIVSGFELSMHTDWL